MKLVIVSTTQKSVLLRKHPKLGFPPKDAGFSQNKGLPIYDNKPHP